MIELQRLRAVSLLSAERNRQIKGEKWSAEHDDEHVAGELARLAAYYCYANLDRPDIDDRIKSDLFTFWGTEEWFKPKDDIRNLVRAGALILAEIERLLRKGPQEEK